MLEKFKQEFVNHVKGLQNQITKRMQDLDIEIKINEDNWSRVDHIGEPGGVDQISLKLICFKL